MTLRHACLALASGRPISHTHVKTSLVLCRSFFRFPSKNDAENVVYRKRFHQERLLGWSNEQLFELVSNVNEYQYFLPACIRSRVTKQLSDREMVAELEIGVPPIIQETYVSHIRLSPPHLLTASSDEGRLFHHLNTVWRFSPGLAGVTRTSTVAFSLDFEFKSRLYAQLVHTVFDQMARQTMSAFTDRAAQLYGPPFPVSESKTRGSS